MTQVPEGREQDVFPLVTNRKAVEIAGLIEERYRRLYGLEQTRELPSQTSEDDAAKRALAAQKAEKEKAAIRERFAAALAKWPAAVGQIEKLLSKPSAEPDLRRRSGVVFDELASLDVETALEKLAEAHTELSGPVLDDAAGARAVKLATREFVLLIYEPEEIEEIREQARDGAAVVVPIPAQSVTGAELVEARLLGRSPAFARLGGGAVRPQRPHGEFAYQLPPACGPATFDRFTELLDEFVFSKLLLLGEEVLAPEERRKRARERLQKKSEDKKTCYYFVVNAPEWEIAIGQRMNRNVFWYEEYKRDVDAAIDKAKAAYPEIAFFSLDDGRDAAKNESNVLWAVLDMLHDGELTNEVH